MTEIDGSIGCNEFCFWGLAPFVDGKSVWQRMLIKKSVDVLRVIESLSSGMRYCHIIIRCYLYVIIGINIQLKFLDEPVLK